MTTCVDGKQSKVVKPPPSWARLHPFNASVPPLDRDTLTVVEAYLGPCTTRDLLQFGGVKDSFWQWVSFQLMKYGFYRVGGHANFKTRLCKQLLPKICVNCDAMDLRCKVDPFSLDPVCAVCKCNCPNYRQVTRTRAQNEFGVTVEQLDKLRSVTGRTRYYTCTLYRESDLIQLACERYGSLDGLHQHQEALRLRKVKTAKRKLELKERRDSIKRKRLDSFGKFCQAHGAVVDLNLPAVQAYLKNGGHGKRGKRGVSRHTALFECKMRMLRGEEPLYTTCEYESDISESD